MLAWVGRVLKLFEDHRPGNALAQRLGGLDGSGHAVLSRCQFHMRPISFHKVATFHAHRLGHGEDELVALHGGGQRQAHARVAAGGLDDGGARLEGSLPLGIFYHGQAHAVFHAAARVKKLHLRYDGRVEALKSGKLAEFDQWRVANEVGDVLVYHNRKLGVVRFVLACCAMAHAPANGGAVGGVRPRRRGYFTASNAWSRSSMRSW